MYKNKAYILTRGIKQEVYSNLSVLCRDEKLDYGKVYRSIKTRKVYAEVGILITEKEIIKTKRL